MSEHASSHVFSKSPAEVIAQALARHPWNSYHRAAHGEHGFGAACGVCRGDLEALANVAVDALAGAGQVIVPAAYIAVALTSPVELTTAQDLRDHVHARDELLAAARAVLAEEVDRDSR